MNKKKHPVWAKPSTARQRRGLDLRPLISLWGLHPLSALQTAAAGSPEHAQLVAGIKVEFEQFYELRQITKVQQLVPASMPDVANLQSNMYGMDTFTSGWRIQLKVDNEMIFVAPRQLQQQFCEVTCAVFINF